MNRKKHSTAFKAKVALEAIKEQKTTSEIASEYGVHSSQIGRWRKQALAEFPKIFSSDRKREERSTEELQSQLYQQIGQLKVELDWLKKKSGLLV